MKNHSNRLRTALFGALAAAGLAACSPAADNATSAGSSSDKSVRLVYVEWASCVAATHVVQNVLEQQGYKVETLSVSGAAMYTALAQGDADATVCAWLPSTHGNYFERTKEKLDDLGANMEGTRIGLVVPSYVSIDSIDQLAAHADKFKGRIIGIDPGAGEMDITHKAIETYQLPLKLIDGSDATMTAALKDAIDNKEWVVVTGWTPHWKWARWDLKYLADPKGSYGGPETINTVVRKGLKEAQPQAWQVLDGFHWTAEQMQQVMAADQQEGSDPVANATAWVAGNADLVQQWVTGSNADTGTASKP